jgi:hypothetical protein
MAQKSVEHKHRPICPVRLERRHVRVQHWDRQAEAGAQERCGHQ